ncbi:hypothetical protein [Nocardia sp. NPDC058480]|uniref:hypothetical protein n=1 Tax=unclassified Nocardia TaxID=2637762 RepID=UPI00365BECB0
MSSDAAQQNRRDDYSAMYGQLILHAENSVSAVRKRTVRWALLVALSLVMAGVVVLYVFRVAEPGSGPPPWWIYVPLFSAGGLLFWGFWEFLDLLSACRHAGWSVDVYEQGVIESRFGTARQAMPFSGGVLDLHRTLFTSPHPQHGSGRLTAPWRGELAQAASKIDIAAKPVLVRETLAQLRTGHLVSFPGKRNGKPGITLTPNMLRLPDGREYVYTSMRMHYSISDGTGGYTATDDPARANVLGFSDDRGDGVRGLQRTSPNLAVVREVLHILIDPDGHTTYYEKFSHQEQEKQ